MEPDGSQARDNSTLWRKNATQRRERRARKSPPPRGSGRAAASGLLIGQNVKPGVALKSFSTGTLASKTARALTSVPVTV